MNKSHLIGACCVFTLFVFANTAQAGLINSGFESPDASSGDVNAGFIGLGWIGFADAFTSSTIGPGSAPVSHADNAGTLGAGTQSLKTFGVGGASGAYQDDNSVVAGQAYDLEAWVMNWAGDPFQNLGILQLQFWGGPNGSGTKLLEREAYACALGCLNSAPWDYDLNIPQDGADVTDWTRMVVHADAPIGTQSARVYLLHIDVPDGGSGGSIYWDDVSLTQVPVPAAVWLFGSGLLGLVGLSRRKARA